MRRIPVAPHASSRRWAQPLGGQGQGDARSGVADAARGCFDCACDAQLKAEIDRYASRMGARERAMSAAVKMTFSVGICNPF